MDRFSPILVGSAMEINLNLNKKDEEGFVVPVAGGSVKDA